MANHGEPGPARYALSIISTSLEIQSSPQHENIRKIIDFIRDLTSSGDSSIPFSTLNEITNLLTDNNPNDYNDTWK